MENQILLEKIGDTKNKNLIDDCYKIYKENLNKQFPDYFDKNISKMCSLVTITEKEEIKSIGMSCLNDLLSDNWGLWLNAILGGVTVNISLRDDSNNLETLRMWSGGDTFNTTNIGAVGSEIRVGTGTTPPTRQDFNIETFEQTITSGNGGYNSGLGKIDIPASIVSITSFSLSETALFGHWHNFGFSPDDYLLSRDIISPVASVIIGQTINVDYNLLLS